jgi:hypothetical protein
MNSHGGKQMKAGSGVQREFKVGDRAAIIGMGSASSIVGSVRRGGRLLYALRGIAGVWPSWLVEAA